MAVWKPHPEYTNAWVTDEVPGAWFSFADYCDPPYLAQRPDGARQSFWNREEAIAWCLMPPVPPSEPDLLGKGVALLAGATGDPDEVVEVVRVFKIRGSRRAVLEHLAHAKAPGSWTVGGMDYVSVWGPIVPVPRPG